MHKPIPNDRIAKIVQGSPSLLPMWRGCLKPWGLTDLSVLISTPARSKVSLVRRRRWTTSSPGLSPSSMRFPLLLFFFLLLLGLTPHLEYFCRTLSGTLYQSGSRSLSSCRLTLAVSPAPAVPLILRDLLTLRGNFHFSDLLTK